MAAGDGHAPIEAGVDEKSNTDVHTKGNEFNPCPDGDTGRKRPAPGRIGFYLEKFEQRLIQFNLEARGLERVHESERITKLSWMSYLQASLLWVSMNLAANNMTLGMLGPATYGLSFRDSALCAVFGALVGALIAAWMATWGPVSGIRTMVQWHHPLWFLVSCGKF